MAKGFGKPQPKPQLSEQAKKRQQAAQEFDKRRKSGDPEFEVYIRIQEKPHWYPVGVIAVQRSQQINQAIFGSLEDLHQGAFRIYPALRKNQDNLEYGYRLKGVKDEPIELAVKPALPGIGGLQAMVKRLFNR